MSKVFKLIELVGVSENSYEEAIQSALNKADETISDLMWFEVEEMRGGIKEDGKIEYQIKLKVAFMLR